MRASSFTTLTEDMVHQTASTNIEQKYRAFAGFITVYGGDGDLGDECSESGVTVSEKMIEKFLVSWLL